MTVQLYAFTCGYLTIPRAFMLAGESGLIVVPIPSYLVVHPKGRLLFDTGLPAETLENPVAHVGEVLASYHQFDFHPGQEVAARLLAMELSPDSIDIVINSHLHFDHCGGNRQLPNADILIQKAELDHARSVQSTNGYLQGDWDTGQRLRIVEGEHDVFGDGSVTCLPTYGHTPGHQSLRVQTEEGGEFILCGDACYLKKSLEDLHLPGIIADKEAALGVLNRLREMQARGSRIMYGHDLEFWKSIAQAPIRLG
jgi:N-acyl homoserine lactone hydrolase